MIDFFLSYTKMTGLEKRYSGQVETLVSKQVWPHLARSIYQRAFPFPGIRFHISISPLSQDVWVFSLSFDLKRCFCLYLKNRGKYS